jgi:hypothetical protein
VTERRPIEARIKHWREENFGEETEDYVELLCVAEATIRRLRRQLRRVLGK